VSSTGTLLLVPNHSMCLESEGVRIEAAEADMLRGVRARFAGAGIAAFATRGENASLSGIVSKSEATFHRLNALEPGGWWLQKVINYARAALTLPFVVRRYDLLYIFCPGHCGSLAALWARVLGKRYGLYVRGTWLNRRAATSFWWSRVFAGASFMIVTGEAFRRRLTRYCANVVNEVPLTALRPEDIDQPAREERGTARLLFAGRLTATKGILDVVRAVALLRNEGRQVEVTVAGSANPDELSALTRLCDGLGVRAAVRILGHVPPAALVAAYRTSGIFVFPSYYVEGFPRVLYEAMMFSLAIVTCELPGTEGFLTDGVNCLHCSPSDPERLAQCLRRLLDDPSLADRLGRRARVDVGQLYDSFIDDSHAQQLSRLAGST
jgi:glycosyltransferase involved in cell wall biosynthesis